MNFVILGHTELLPDAQNCSLDAQHGVLEAGLSVLEAGLGGPERHLGDYCMLLNGLGRFQNALGTFQEAPERETFDVSMVLGGFGGVSPRARQPAAGIVRPPKSRFFKTDQTPLELGKGKGNGLG